jgi:hypothetical protein
MERSSPQGLFSRLTRLVRTVAAPLLPPGKPIPMRAAISGPDRSTQRLQTTNGDAGAKEVHRTAEQASTLSIDPPTQRKPTLEQAEAYQAGLRQQLSNQLKGLDSGKVSIESLREAQANGQTVLGSTAPRGSRSATTKLSDGAALHPRAFNSQIAREKRSLGKHPNREAHIPSVPQLPKEQQFSISKNVSSSSPASKSSEANVINTSGTTPGRAPATHTSPSGPENEQDPHVRPAYGDSLADEIKTRPQLNPRSRSSGR